MTTRAAAHLDLLPQPQQVEALLASEPDNAEYVELKSGLVEVIGLTKDLLVEAVANEASGGATAAATTTTEQQPAAPPPARKRKSRWEEAPAPATEAAATAPSSETTTRGAAASATTTTTTAAAKAKLAPPLLVLPPDKDEDGDNAAARDNNQPNANDDSAEARYRAPELPKRRGAEAPASAADAAAIAAEEMPKWLEIKPGDDEKERERKRKKQKAWKSKRRLATRDLEARAKQASWQAFAAKGGGGVGGKKKGVGGVGGGSNVGGSIYSVPPDDPLRRVGVVAAPKRTE